MENNQIGICLINTSMSKRSIISFLFLISFSILKAQDENKVFEKIEVNAYTSQKTWTEHIATKTQLPDSVLKNIPAGSYKVKVQFVVDIHGNIGQVKVKNDPGYGLAQRATSIISSYKGKWQPANQCGRNVKTYKEEAITFLIPVQ